MYALRRGLPLVAIALGGRLPLETLVGVFDLAEFVLACTGLGILPCVLLDGRFIDEGVLDLEKGGLAEEGGLFLRIETGSLEVPDGVKSGAGATGFLEVKGVLDCAGFGFVPARSLCDLL